MSASLIGLEGVMNALSKTANNIEEGLKALVDETADAVCSDAKDNVHSDYTGDLAESIAVEEKPDKTGYAKKVGPSDGLRQSSGGIPYSILHEFGTTKSPAKPFLRPAYRAHVQEFKAKAKKILSK
jgi:HK97 gp10 family phage protein